MAIQDNCTATEFITVNGLEFEVVRIYECVDKLYRINLLKGPIETKGNYEALCQYMYTILPDLKHPRYGYVMESWSKSDYTPLWRAFIEDFNLFPTSS
jgi:hypothetical protein